MPRYDFTSLSCQDFEELSRDLLQAEWKTPLEAFKAGRDKGIDLRYAPAHGGKTVIQCKHYVGSGFSTLLRHLRDRERRKIEALRPTRYVVVTSVGLTPGNKEEIATALRPFIVNLSDVIGAQDLEGLLSRHPEVERANFKLWLTNTNVIERVIHNAQVCQTEFEVNRIMRKLPRFVQSNAFPRAMRMLDETKIIVISGVPGIGKTTLAEMLLYTHLEQGYEPVVIKAEIAEGKTFFKPDAKRIFYYDDFLGQFYLGDRAEYLGRNQDAALIDFMEMVSKSRYGRFILTTREHILHTALQMSERLTRSAMLERRCILELSDYSYAHKARILYNHLYFSDLPSSYKKAVLKEDFFLDIIKHEHFSPRLVEWLSTELRQREVNAKDYRGYISRLLQSPTEIWTGAFRNQISHAARHILLSFYTLGDWVSTLDLEPAFRSFHSYSATKYNLVTAPGDFRNALQELDGAFLSYSSGHGSYLNPSIREFIASVISGDRDTAEDLLTSSIRFRQVANLWELSEARPGSALAELFASTSTLLTVTIPRLLQGPWIRWENSRPRLRGVAIDMHDEARIGFIVELSDAQQSPELVGIASKATDQLVAGWNHVIPTFGSVIRLVNKMSDKVWFASHGGRVIRRQVLDSILNHLTFATASDWLDLTTLRERNVDLTEDHHRALARGLQEYCENGARDDRRNRENAGEKRDLKESLSQLGAK